MRRLERKAIGLVRDLLPSQVDPACFTSGRLPGSALSRQLNILTLALGSLPAARQNQILANLLAAAPHVLLIDWQLPERNLEAPAAMLCRTILSCLARQRGGQSWMIFREYERQGALQGVLYREKNQIRVLRCLSFYGGALAVALLTLP